MIGESIIVDDRFSTARSTHMPTRISILKTLILAMLALGLGATRSDGSDLKDMITAVELRSTVRLAPDHGELSLGDLAAITGPQAGAIESIELTDHPQILDGQWVSIEVKSIRALIDQTPGIHGGSITIEGHDVSITRRSMANTSLSNAEIAPIKMPVSAGPVLRDHLESWIYAHLHTDQSTTRIRSKERDAQILKTPTSGRVVEISEFGQSEQMSVRVVIYEGEKIILDTTLRLDVQVLRRVRVCTAQIRRGSVIDDSNSSVETRWLSPMSPIADPRGSQSQVSKTTINPGTILQSSMLEEPIIVRRGKIVSARSLAGTVSVSMSVRALDDGRMGDLIELESRDRKQHFTARVAGAGRVVIVQNPPKSPNSKRGS